MMSLRSLTLLAAASLSIAGCSTFSDTVDKINPFASSGPKMAVLTPITQSIEPRDQWSASIGKAGDYTFTPAVVSNAVYVAARDGSLSKLVDGRAEWSIKAGQPLSAGRRRFPAGCRRYRQGRGAGIFQFDVAVDDSSETLVAGRNGREGLEDVLVAPSRQAGFRRDHFDLLVELIGLVELSARPQQAAEQRNGTRSLQHRTDQP